MRRRRLLVSLAVGCAAGALALLLGRLPLAETIEWKLYDRRVRWAADPSTARPDIVLVAIDEKSVRQLEPVVGRWPWPRLVHAALVDFLARAPARLVAYDVLFIDRDRRAGFDVGDQTWTGEESDRAFAEAVARAANVVLLADATFEGTVDREAGNDGGKTLPVPSAPGASPEVAGAVYALDTTFEARPVIAPPYAELASAARGLGHNYFVLDPDGPVRRVVPFVRYGRGALPSLAVAAVAAIDGLAPADVRADGEGVRLGTRHVPLVTDRLPSLESRGPAAETGRRLLVDYRGPAVLPDGHSTTYRSYSFYDLFYSEQQLLAGEPPLVDPGTFRDRIVVVGTTAAGLHDVFTVPFAGEGGKMPGVQVHASVIDQLLSSRFIRPASPVLGAALVLGLSLLAAGLVVAASPRVAGPGVAVIAGAVVLLADRLFRQGSLVPLAQPLVGMALAGVGALGYRYFVEGREKRQVKRLFSRYLSRDVYEQVLANPALAELGGRRREMSVLFSDIRGFTSFTEEGHPEAVVAQLNEYFSRMVDVVFAHQGTLDKFVGDMVVALFGAPLDDADHADHALQAALGMLDALDELNRVWAAAGRPGLRIGIGVNSGEMIAGNIGSERVRSYTVIGDAVNLGARLQGLNKDYGTTILVSEETARRLKGRYDLRPLGTVTVKGRSQPVAILEARRGGAAQGVPDARSHP